MAQVANAGRQKQTFVQWTNSARTSNDAGNGSGETSTPNSGRKRRMPHMSSMRDVPRLPFRGGFDEQLQSGGNGFPGNAGAIGILTSRTPRTVLNTAVPHTSISPPEIQTSKFLTHISAGERQRGQSTAEDLYYVPHPTVRAVKDSDTQAGSSDVQGESNMRCVFRSPSAAAHVSNRPVHSFFSPERRNDVASARALFTERNGGQRNADFSNNHRNSHELPRQSQSTDRLHSRRQENEGSMSNLPSTRQMGSEGSHGDDLYEHSPRTIQRNHMQRDYMDEGDSEAHNRGDCEENDENCVDEGMQEQGMQYQETGRTQQLALRTEVDKRRDRRHIRAAREKEGARRLREGLPWNKLKVDQYTGEPFGDEVGAWRREVKLLSKRLDPVIGHIKHQPHDGLQEIARLMQQTWEYTSPVRFDILKSAIARCVTLRRADLMDRIRWKQAKPDDISDRTWRIMSAEINDPVRIKKSQNCSKANASRLNFGRTGPAGEVGVRHRLQDQFGRSPSPRRFATR